MIRNRTSYQWDLETFDPESGDILDHHHAESLSALPWPSTPGERLVLVRDVGNDLDGLQCRSWAYVDESRMLPAEFTIPDETGTERSIGVRVPQRFHREIARAACGK
jgi:hypothetical protein